MKRFVIATAMVLTTAIAAPAFAESEEFIDQIQGYLEISEKYLTLANRKDAAIFFAVEGIVEIHEDRGEKAMAAPVLKKILDSYPNNQTVRNIIHFKLRDVYREIGNAEMAMAELAAVIEENR